MAYRIGSAARCVRHDLDNTASQHTTQRAHAHHKQGLTTLLGVPATLCGWFKLPSGPAEWNPQEEPVRVAPTSSMPGKPSNLREEGSRRRRSDALDAIGLGALCESSMSPPAASCSVGVSKPEARMKEESGPALWGLPLCWYGRGVSMNPSPPLRAEIFILRR